MHGLLTDCQARHRIYVCSFANKAHRIPGKQPDRARVPNQERFRSY